MTAPDRMHQTSLKRRLAFGEGSKHGHISGSRRKDDAPYDRQRYRRLAEERVALGLCLKCGQAQPAPDHSLCQSCTEKRRKAERDRYAARPRPPASNMVAGTRNDAAGSHAEGASSAISHVRTPASAYVAASNIPLKAVWSARPAAR